MKKRKLLPNLLTLFRLIAAPLLLLVWYLPLDGRESLWASALFLAGGLTDFLDGYIARRFDQKTELGTFLDPLADKVLVSAALVLVVAHYQTMLVTLAAALILAREMLVVMMRAWGREKFGRELFPSNWYGRWKMAVQIAALSILLLRAPDLYQLGLWTLWAGVALSLIAVVPPLLQMRRLLSKD